MESSNYHRILFYAYAYHLFREISFNCKLNFEFLLEYLKQL